MPDILDHARRIGGRVLEHNNHVGIGAPVVDAEGNEAVKDLGLGLAPDAFYQVIKQVGNYQEIFDRNLTPIGLSIGGPNQLWTEGGLLYTPPFR